MSDGRPCLFHGAEYRAFFSLKSQNCWDGLQLVNSDALMQKLCADLICLLEASTDHSASIEVNLILVHNFAVTNAGEARPRVKNTAANWWSQKI